MSSIEKDCLLSVPWRVQCVDGTRYILKGQFGEAGYELLFSDLSTIWQERLSADDVLLRSKVNITPCFYGYMFLTDTES